MILSPMDWSPPRRPALLPSALVEPCIPSLSDRAPTGPAWVHEVKHDGYRLMVWRHGERVRLFTLGLEGIVSKRRDAPCQSGRSKGWIKVKNPESPAMRRFEDGSW